MVGFNNKQFIVLYRQEVEKYEKYENIISANLRYLRNIQGWSQEDIAEKSE